MDQTSVHINGKHSLRSVLHKHTHTFNLQQPYRIPHYINLAASIWQYIGLSQNYTRLLKSSQQTHVTLSHYTPQL